MSDDLYEVWRDDCLIEAAARGDLLELETDPAAGPLVALSMLADGRPLPKLDIDGAALVDSRRNHRYAVRSLAVAVTVVATLSTSGVAAVVTGDPLRPAKAVWHQIQDETGLRADADANAHAGSAFGAPSSQPVDPAVSRPSAVAAGPSPAEGLTARAPFQWPDEGMQDQPAPKHRAQTSGAEATAEPDSAQPTSDDSDTYQSEEQDQTQEPAQPTDSDQQEPGDEAGAEPAPGDEQQPSTDDQSGDDGLDDLIESGGTGLTGDDGSSQVDPTQSIRSAEGDAEQEQVLPEPSSQPPAGSLDGTTDGTTDGTSTEGSTATETTILPPHLSP